NTNSKLNKMSWNSYCLQMHEISNSTRVDDAKKVRKILQKFYMFTFDNNSNKTIKKNLEPYIKYLLDHELRFENMNNSHTKHILTNFPISAKAEQLHQIKNVRGRNNIFNIFLNTENELVRDLLKSFID